VTHPQVRYQTARRVEIDADASLEVQADGDLVGRTPAVFEVRPGALRALALDAGLR
jgi:diacylglycerol kinase family enzyme